MFRAILIKSNFEFFFPRNFPTTTNNKSNWITSTEANVIVYVGVHSARDDEIDCSDEGQRAMDLDDSNDNINDVKNCLTTYSIESASPPHPIISQKIETYPRAISKLLMSFLIFQISTFRSADVSSPDILLLLFAAFFSFQTKKNLFSTKSTEKENAVVCCRKAEKTRLRSLLFSCVFCDCVTRA